MSLIPPIEQGTSQRQYNYYSSNIMEWLTVELKEVLWKRYIGTKYQTVTIHKLNNFTQFQTLVAYSESGSKSTVVADIMLHFGSANPLGHRGPRFGL